MFGITQRVARSHGFEGEMKLLPLSFAKAIAKVEYWDKYLCDQFDPRIGFVVFDAAFNGGHPAQWLQRAVGIPEDGIIGAGTIGSIRVGNPVLIAVRFCAYHLEYYTALKNPTFIDGWGNRIATNLLLVARDD
jgi:lysozyme family protein